MAYCSMYNAFFMDLSVSSHSSLLTAKSADLAVKCGASQFHKEIAFAFFIVAVLIAEVLLNNCRFVLMCNGLNIADKEM